MPRSSRARSSWALLAWVTTPRLQGSAPSGKHLRSPAVRWPTAPLVADAENKVPTRCRVGPSPSGRSPEASVRSVVSACSSPTGARSTPPASTPLSVGPGTIHREQHPLGAGHDSGGDDRALLSKSDRALLVHALRDRGRRHHPPDDAVPVHHTDVNPTAAHLAGLPEFAVLALDAGTFMLIDPATSRTILRTAQETWTAPDGQVFLQDILQNGRCRVTSGRSIDALTTSASAPCRWRSEQAGLRPGEVLRRETARALVPRPPPTRRRDHRRSPHPRRQLARADRAARRRRRHDRPRR